MRVLAIGDIHGCHRSLITLAKWVPFRSDDVLVTIGDYVDRGPDTKSVLDWLIARKEQGTRACPEFGVSRQAASD